VRSKTWFPAAVCTVIALSLGLWWSLGGEEKSRQVAVVQVQDQQDKIVNATETSECPRLQKTKQQKEPRTQVEGNTRPVPYTTWDGPAQFTEHLEPEQRLVTIQGVVEYMDPCTQTIIVDGVSIDASRQGNFPDYYQAYKEGDFVGLTYKENNSSKLLHSLEMIQKKLK